MKNERAKINAGINDQCRNNHIFQENALRYLYLVIGARAASVRTFGADFLVIMMSRDPNFSNSRPSVDYFVLEFTGKTLQEKIVCQNFAGKIDQVYLRTGRYIIL